LFISPADKAWLLAHIAFAGVGRIRLATNIGSPDMFYKLAADAVVLLHLGFVMFVVAGGLLVFRWRWIALLHLPVVVWAVLLEFHGWLCPLTPLELSLRESGGQAGYSGGFVEHYILPVLYPVELDTTLQFAMGSLVIVINVALYGCLLWRLKNRDMKR
jgi:hypothetical protein